jgi:pimeloyl-ACP methyl ester carboxylesterase
VRSGADKIPELTREIETQGVEQWARRNMAGRLGDAFPPAGVEWWTKFMGRTAQSTELGFNASINYSDIRADIGKITCPTLVITTEGSGLETVEETRAWQQSIADSRLLVLPGNSYHVAATHAEQCAKATLDFIKPIAVR